MSKGLTEKQQEIWNEGFLAGFGKGYKQGERAGLVLSAHPQKHKCVCGSWKTYFTQYGWRCRECFEKEFRESTIRKKLPLGTKRFGYVT